MRNKLANGKCVAAIATLLTLTLLQGCASLQMQEVKAWERGTLAQTDMQFGANPGLDRALYKTFAAKEAAQGSGKAGGGGCGCN
jgi:hypothetical protein